MKRFVSVILISVMLLGVTVFYLLLKIRHMLRLKEFIHIMFQRKATITDCQETASGEITIPSTLGGYPVTGIGSTAFYKCVNITSVIIRTA